MRAWFASVLALAGCAGCAGETDERPATWVYIAPTIVIPSCGTVRCHSRFTATEGLQLDTVEGGYAALVGGGHVAPGQPQQSRLMFLLRGEEVLQMPPDLRLPDGDIALIERWILEGAPYE